MYDENKPQLTQEEKEAFIDIAFSEDGCRDLENEIINAFGFNVTGIKATRQTRRNSSSSYTVWESDPLDMSNDPIARAMFTEIQLDSFNEIWVVENGDKRLGGEWVVVTGIHTSYHHTSGGHNGTQIGEAYFNLDTAKWILVKSENKRAFWDDY